MNNIEGDSVIFTETEGSSVEYWEYEYNLQNRLSRVRKNGEVIAEFLYDADGMRIKSTEKILEEETNRTSYYVYSYSGSVLMEESTDNGSSNSPEAKYNSYIYAFGKIFAKVDGILDSTYITAEDIFYFHHDNLGSTRLISDGAGNVVMEQDYMPFGEDLPVVGQTEVLDEEAGGYKYTGQKEVISIGLYYYGARYYDPSIGRFITEDTYPGEMINPQSQNLYVYVMNNPLRYIDPTGNVTEETIEGISVETGMYFENKYLLFIVDLNLHILQIRYKETKTESGEIIYQYPITEFHQDAVNADLTINAGFFGESWNPTSATVGDIIMDGNYKSFYKVNYKEGKDAPYFIVWNDNNGKQDFVFAPMEIQKEGWYKGSYLIPEEYRDSNYGLGNVGPLINQGNIVDSSKSYHTQWNVKPTSRTIFGVNQQQDKAYFFIGVGEWTLNKAAELLIEKGVYYGVFLDGGGSTQVITNNPKYNYYTGRPITSVIQTKSRNK